MPTYDGIGSSVTHEIEVVGDVFISNVEGGSLSTQVPFEIFSNVSGMVSPPTDSRQLRLRVQPTTEASPDDSYVTDMGIQNTTDNYFFITAPQNTSSVGDQNTFVISKTSNVGIGTTDPEKPLHVVGDSWITGTLTASNIIGASPVTISSSIVMAAGTTLTTGAIEPPAGSESNLKITGTITTSNIVAQTNENLLISSNLEVGTSNLFVNTANGNVGIGVASPGRKLSIKTNWATNDYDGFEIKDNNDNIYAIIAAQTTDVGGARSAGYLRLFNTTGVPTDGILLNGSSSSYINGGNVGIGTDSPLAPIHMSSDNTSLDATDGATFDQYSLILHNTRGGGANGTEIGLCFNHYDSAYPTSSRTPGAAITHERTTSWSKGKLHFKTKQGATESSDCVTAMTINEDGNVGIGTASPTAKLDILGAYDSNELKVKIDDGTTNLTIRNGHKPSTSGYQTGWVTLDPNSGGGVAIWDALHVQGTLQVSSTKNFIIDHPVHPTTKKLIHTAVESPRVDLIYRGSIQLENGTAIVNIDRDCTGEKTCAMEDGTFEALCRDPVYYLQNATDFSRVIGTINNNLLTIISEDTNSTSVINWMVVAERKDRDILESKQTDDNGRLVTEILDDTERINRDGSKRY